MTMIVTQAPKRIKSGAVSQDRKRVFLASALEVLSNTKYYTKKSTPEFRIKHARAMLKELLHTDSIKSQSAIVRGYLLRQADEIIDQPNRSTTKGPDSSIGNNPVQDKKVPQSLYQTQAECEQKNIAAGASPESAKTTCAAFFGKQVNMTPSTDGDGFTGTTKSASVNNMSTNEMMGALNGIDVTIQKDNGLRSASEVPAYYFPERYAEKVERLQNDNQQQQEESENRIKSASTKVPYFVRLHPQYNK